MSHFDIWLETKQYELDEELDDLDNIECEIADFLRKSKREDEDLYD